jgi:hypothetical protein
MFRPLLISLCLTSTALATTWTVDDDGKADFDNIQAAVDAASDGDEIIVMPGTYTGTGDNVIDMLGKEIWLHSSKGAQVTIIYGEVARRGINCSNGETSNTIIEGFSIIGGRASIGGGMYVYNSSPTLTDCIFAGNTANDNGGGMYNTSNSTPVITNCTFMNNTANSNGGGMYNNSSSPTLTYTAVCGNTPNQIIGEWTDNGGNTVAYTCSDDGACCVGTSCSIETATNCSAAGGTYLGDDSSCADNPCDPDDGACCVGTSCSIETATNCSTAGGTHLGDGSSCAYNPCGATPWTVDDDGKADFNNIQAAVDAAINGDEIIVAPGTYTSTTDEVVDMLGKEIWLHSSGGAGVTIIDGQGVRRGILCDNEETSNTIIEGLTIIRGFTQGNYPANCGGGIYNSSSSPTLTDCTFVENRAPYGSGMFNNNNSSPTLDNCTFTNNTGDGKVNAGTGMYNYSSSPTLTNCRFEGNSGGGMDNLNSNPTLINCRFEGNSGGGMDNTNSSPTLINCTFNNNNSSFYGGGMFNYSGSNPTMTDCTFTNNTAGEWGGGMDNYSSSPTLTGCTFTSNYASRFGGGMGNDEDSNPTLTNCTFTGNTANNGGGMYNNDNSNPTLTDTTVCGNTPDQIFGDWTDNVGNTIADVCPIDCPDINGDGYVNVSDLLVVIDQWGLTNSPADVNFDGIVDVSDLLIVVNNWGACP